jgi:hypothetical protein
MAAAGVPPPFWNATDQRLGVRIPSGAHLQPSKHGASSHSQDHQPRPPLTDFSQEGRPSLASGRRDWLSRHTEPARTANCYTAHRSSGSPNTNSRTLDITQPSSFRLADPPPGWSWHLPSLLHHLFCSHRLGDNGHVGFLWKVRADTEVILDDLTRHRTVDSRMPIVRR